VMNLVLNAAEALGEKPGTVTLSTGFETLTGEQQRYSRFTASELQEGRHVFLEVRDDGCGMDEETVSKVFDPFFTTKFVGRGLGLSAVLGIIRGHKGGLDVSSEPGRGTSVRVLFPVVEQPPAATPAAPEADPDSVEGTVLVIDDEDVVRETVCAMLRPVGLRALAAESGAAGLESYEREKANIGLVLLDHSMPEMNGEETFRRLRSLDPDVRVVLTSGFGEEEATSRFEGLGLMGFIQKPYRCEKLVAEIRRCLEAGPRTI
jgi:two-component system cell cycle sensor histidine kinase/response regulator CckA